MKQLFVYSLKRPKLTNIKKKETQALLDYFRGDEQSCSKEELLTFVKEYEIFDDEMFEMDIEMTGRYD